MQNETLAPDDYQIPARNQQAEIKIKGSRFIATVYPVSDKEMAENMYTDHCKKFYNATHNCYAYRIDDQTFRFSDDGEPSGTAGLPILKTIDGRDIKKILCVVTRYFGGTKLGTGGLIRAYSDAAQHVLEQLTLKKMTRMSLSFIELKYEQERLVRREMQNFNGILQKSDYSANIIMQIAIPESKMEHFINTLNEKTNATLKITVA